MPKIDWEINNCLEIIFVILVSQISYRILIEIGRKFWSRKFLSRVPKSFNFFEFPRKKKHKTTDCPETFTIRNRNSFEWRSPNDPENLKNLFKWKLDLAPGWTKEEAKMKIVVSISESFSLMKFWTNSEANSNGKSERSELFSWVQRLFVRHQATDNWNRYGFSATAHNWVTE